MEPGEGAYSSLRGSPGHGSPVSVSHQTGSQTQDKSLKSYTNGMQRLCKSHTSLIQIKQVVHIICK